MSVTDNLWLVVLGSIAATYLWRLLGTAFAKQINPDGAVFQWITCVSYAMLAGLIARMVFIPVGSLVEVELWIRVTAIAVGLAAFFLLKRQVFFGVSAGLLVFVLLAAR